VAVVFVAYGAGIQTSTRGSGNVKDAGITPRTSVGIPSRVIGRPTTFGSCPNRRTQNPCERTAVADAPGAASLSSNQRPSAGVTRNTDGSEDVVRDTRIRSGLPCPVNVSSLAAT